MNALVLTLLLFIAVAGHAQTPAGQKKEQAIKQEMQRLAAYEVDLVLRSDTAAMERFYPNDMIVTNPFN
jgi:hypothetical protein